MVLKGPANALNRACVTTSLSDGSNTTSRRLARRDSGAFQQSVAEVPGSFVLVAGYRPMGLRADAQSRS